MNEAYFILYVADQVRSAAYYGAVLGLDPILDVPGMTEFRLVDRTILGIMPIEGAGRLLGRDRFDPSAGSNVPKAELYLVVEDPAAYHRRALEHGGVELSPLQTRDWGHRAAYSLDLDGCVLAFAEKIAGSRAGP